MRTQLHNPRDGQMRVAGLMSGSGSNLRKIIEFERSAERSLGFSPYNVAVIFTDNAESNAVKIGKDNDVPVFVRDIGAFYSSRGMPRRDLKVREEFDSETAKILKSYGVSVAAYAGYMSIVTYPMIDSFVGVNVHPADLSLMNGVVRKYTGDRAVRDAILSGEKELRATTHLIESRVDYGRILMISEPVQVDLPKDFNMKDEGLVKRVADEYQSRLKEAGDLIIFPQTLWGLSKGRYSQDEKGLLYFEDKPIPSGIRFSDLE